MNSKNNNLDGININTFDSITFIKTILIKGYYFPYVRSLRHQKRLLQNYSFNFTEWFSFYESISSWLQQHPTSWYHPQALDVGSIRIIKAKLSCSWLKKLLNSNWNTFWCPRTTDDLLTSSTTWKKHKANFSSLFRRYWSFHFISL